MYNALIRFLLILITIVFAHNEDHLLLTRIVTQPNEAESFSIYNPTALPIELTDYYVCDDENYYKIQCNWNDNNNECSTEINLAPSSNTRGFTAKFPDIIIAPGDTLHIVLNENFSEFYGENFIPDLVMYGSEINSMLETEPGSIGFSNNKIAESSELIILFKWDGVGDHLIKDIDYFLWGAYQTPINKTGKSTYQNDTPPINQLYFDGIAEKYYAYSRLGIEEIDEIQTNGNGIISHDETSENFRSSWEIREIFKMGCTDSSAPNYDTTAEIDDGSCFISFKDLINGLYDCNTSSNGYCDSSPTCPVVRLRGMIVDYFDVTVYGGPHAITIEDEDGYRVEATIWPEEWDIAADDTSNYLITPPYNRFLLETRGSVFEYDGEKQILICSPSDFFVIESFDQEGFYTQNDSAIVQISPVPFVLLPSMGETLDFSYSFLDNSRVIVRIMDISGRFITSLVDKYYTSAGSVSRHEDKSAWDGRDHLGQIVTPGIYIMHIETMNPITGETHTDAAPVVVGVKN